MNPVRPNAIADTDQGSALTLPVAETHTANAHMRNWHCRWGIGHIPIDPSG